LTDTVRERERGIRVLSCLLTNCWLSLGKLFQDDGEQFRGSLPRAAGLDALDCLPQYFFCLGLWQNPCLTSAAKASWVSWKAARADAAMWALFASIILILLPWRPHFQL
jgi:hypothetical protein